MLKNCLNSGLAGTTSNPHGLRSTCYNSRLQNHSSCLPYILTKDTEYKKDAIAVT